MSLAKSVVSRPVTIFIIILLFVMLGVFAMFNLPVDLYPEINPPYVVVITGNTGAGPEEIETTITRPLEQALSGVPSLQKITSTSTTGSSMVVLQFGYGTDLVDATNFVRDAVQRATRALPTTLTSSPTIFRFDPSMMPIINYRVSSSIRSPNELDDIATNTIAQMMAQSPGVAAANVNGGSDQIVCVEIPETRLEAYNLTVSQIQAMIDAQNVQVAAGNVIDGGVSYLLTTMGEYTSLDEIKNTVIAYAPNPYDPSSDQIPILLGDIADVFWGFADPTSTVLVNSQPALSISVQKQSGTNSVKVVEELRKKIPQIQAVIPNDITITEIYSSTDQISSTLNAVESSAMSGVILAVLVLFLFLRSIKPTLIIGLSIPISIIVTLMFMYFAGLTLNLMTLAGLFLGVGMLVDNSIVILENIYHYREKGAKLRPAAVLGTQEMVIAITASTLTTICVFAPMIMFQNMLEVAGELFFGLAFTIVISLTISLATAVFLVPVLSSHFLPLVTRKQRPLTGPLAKVDDFFARRITGMENGYRRIVAHILKHKLRTIIVLFVLFVGFLTLIPKIGYVFMPNQEADAVTITMTLPLGTPLAETTKQLLLLQDVAQKEIVADGKPAYDRLSINAGGGRMGSAGQINAGTLQITLPDYSVRKLDSDDVQAKMRPHFNEFPGATFQMQANTGMGGRGMGGGMGGDPIDIALFIDDLSHGKEIADKIVNILNTQVPEATEPQIDLQDGLPQLEIDLDRQRMYALGLNAYTVGNEVEAAVGGLTINTKYELNGTDYDIVLRYKEADRSSIPDLEHIFVINSAGKRIPVSNFASIVEGTGPVTINRENKSRAIHVTADTIPGAKLNEVTQKIQSLIRAQIPAEDGLTIQYQGDTEDFQTIGRAFILIILVAIFMVFGVMASLFESFKDPFIILFTIPLSLIGVIAIYLITGQPFNMLTAVGILVLVGVIVNNGIVMVDYANLLRKRGYSLNDACIEAAGNRLRPILMSVLTTVLGLFPLAFFPGQGTELVAPIGKTVFGGLTFGTLMTLFLMPTIYAILNKNDDARRARSAARREGLARGLKGKDLKKLKEEAAGAAKEPGGDDSAAGGGGKTP